MVSEGLHHVRVSLFHKGTGKDTGISGKDARIVDRAEGGKPFLLTHNGVVPSVTWCDVHKTGVLHGDKVGKDNPVLDLLLDRHLLFQG